MSKPRIINLNYFRPPTRSRRFPQMRIGHSTTPWRLFYEGSFTGGWDDFATWDEAHARRVRKGA